MRLACVPMIDPVPTSTSMSFPLSTTATAGVTVMDAVTCNVLIVDDDPHMLRALRELLIGPDRNIIVAQSGEDALDDLGRSPC